MEPKKPDAAPPAPTADASTAELTLSDLVKQLTDFRASVDASLATMRAEIAAHRTVVDERMQTVDALTERQANAKSRAQLASLGVSVAPASNSTAASETIVETYAKLAGPAKVKFWRENKHKLVAFRQ